MCVLWDPINAMRLSFRTTLLFAVSLTAVALILMVRPILQLWWRLRNGWRKKKTTMDFVLSKYEELRRERRQLMTRCAIAFEINSNPTRHVALLKAADKKLLRLKKKYEKLEALPFYDSTWTADDEQEGRGDVVNRRAMHGSRQYGGGRKGAGVVSGCRKLCTTTTPFNKHNITDARPSDNHTTCTAGNLTNNTNQSASPASCRGTVKCHRQTNRKRHVRFTHRIFARQWYNDINNRRVQFPRRWRELPGSPGPGIAKSSSESDSMSSSRCLLHNDEEEGEELVESSSGCGTAPLADARVRSSDSGHIAESTGNDILGSLVPSSDLPIMLKSEEARLEAIKKGASRLAFLFSKLRDRHLMAPPPSIGAGEPR